MIEGLLHEPGERLRTFYADLLHGSDSTSGVFNVENVGRETINVQLLNFNIQLALPLGN
jgi:hypothetical protein